LSGIAALSVYAGVLALLAIGVIVRPPTALAAVCCIFGLKQWGQATNGWLAANPPATNLAIGVLVLCAIVWAATTTLRCSPIWRRRIGRSRVGGHGLPLRLPPDRRIISKRRCDRPDACSPRNRRRSAGGWKRFGSQAARERALTMRDLHHCGSIFDSL